MPGPQAFILGEFRRTLDERYRLSIPGELVALLAAGPPGCFLAKERPGCISLWSAQVWKAKLEEGVQWVQEKMVRGKLDDQIAQVQLFGRLLSTRHRPVQLDDRGRLLIPEGFREFLGVEPGSDLMVVGAAVCVEIWNPPDWLKYLQDRLPKFRRLLARLSD
jgi:MraZ protein